MSKSGTTAGTGVSHTTSTTNNLRSSTAGKQHSIDQSQLTRYALNQETLASQIEALRATAASLQADQMNKYNELTGNSTRFTEKQAASADAALRTLTESVSNADPAETIQQNVNNLLKEPVIKSLTTQLENFNNQIEQSGQVADILRTSPELSQFNEISNASKAYSELTQDPNATEAQINKAAQAVADSLDQYGPEQIINDIESVANKNAKVSKIIEKASNDFSKTKVKGYSSYLPSKESLYKIMWAFLTLASLIGPWLFLLWYKSEHEGCSVYKSDNTTELLNCGPSGGAFSAQKSWYNKEQSRRIYCSCGSKAIDNGSEVDCMDLKMKNNISGDVNCDNESIKEMGRAPYCLNKPFAYTSNTGSEASCPKAGKPGCAPWKGKHVYCKLSGKPGWYYSYRETNIWDFFKDIIPFLGNFLNDGLNEILKWVLIIGAVILGGSLVFFIAKRLIFSEVPHKKSESNSELENINISLSAPANNNS